jgi:outer membrane protein assembly factor BamA
LRSRKYQFFLFILALLFADQAHSAFAGNDTIRPKRSPYRFGALPILGYAPETRMAFGITGFVMRSGDSINHNSNVYFLASITQNRQYTVNIVPDIWWGANRYHLNGELNWQYWPDKYFGLGNQTIDSLKEGYTSKIKGIKLDFYRQISPRLYTGPLVEIEHNNIIKYDVAPYAELPLGTVPGSDRSFITGLGAGLAMDTRNHINYPTDGAFHQLRLVHFRNFYVTGGGYLKMILDLRKYITLGKDHIVRLQGYAKFQFGSDIPFRNLSLLGGGNLMRGYYQGRYRDNHIMALQAEYHSPTFLGRFRGVLFAGMADVFGTYSENDFSTIKPSAGVGLRFAVLKNEKLNLRIDAGLGKGDHGFYFNMMEAF